MHQGAESGRGAGRVTVATAGRPLVPDWALACVSPPCLLSQKFNSKELDSGEEKCLKACAEKYLKLTQRVGFRFAEHQAKQSAAQQQPKR